MVMMLACIRYDAKGDAVSVVLQMLCSYVCTIGESKDKTKERKDAEKHGGIRPIAVGDLIYRTLRKSLLAANLQSCSLLPCQMGVG